MIKSFSYGLVVCMCNICVYCELIVMRCILAWVWVLSFGVLSPACIFYHLSKAILQLCFRWIENLQSTCELSNIMAYFSGYWKEPVNRSLSWWAHLKCKRVSLLRSRLERVSSFLQLKLKRTSLSQVWEFCASSFGLRFFFSFFSFFFILKDHWHSPIPFIFL